MHRAQAYATVRHLNRTSLGARDVFEQNQNISVHGPDGIGPQVYAARRSGRLARKYVESPLVIGALDLRIVDDEAVRQARCTVRARIVCRVDLPRDVVEAYRMLSDQALQRAVHIVMPHSAYMPGTLFLIAVSMMMLLPADASVSRRDRR